MNLKRYRVNNIQEALQQIKKDLGPDAIIVSTRQVKEGKGAFGVFGKTMLEVTAARDVKKAPAKPDFSRTATALAESYGATPAAAKPAPALSTPGTSIKETQRMLLPIQQEISHLRDLMQDFGTRPLASDQQVVQQLKQEMAEMRLMLQTLAARSQQVNEPDLPENLLILFQQMTFNGLDEKFARRLVQECLKNIPSAELENFSYAKIFMARMLMKIIKTTSGIEKISSPQKIISLIGPTGVGKTTTVAKIASDQILNYKRKVGLITQDTFRIGAVEQLRTYAKIMNAQLSVVTSKTEMGRAITDFGNCDVVLIDTGGRSQRDESQMYELREMFDGQRQVHSILVLSATTKDNELNEITRRFGELPLSSVIFTKLDETATYGCLFNHSIRFKKPISFLTTGQKVPEDIETASKERLVDLLLNISGN